MRRRAFLRGVGTTGGLALAGPLVRSATAGRVGALDRTGVLDRTGALARLREAQIAVTARATPIAPTDFVKEDLMLETGLQARRDLRSGALHFRAAAVAGLRDAVDLFATFRTKKGTTAPAVGLGLAFGVWSRENYVLLPGACYAGNRFASRFVGYPPLLTEPADIGPHVPPIVSDIPRLNLHAGPSHLEIPTSDLATPAAAIFLPSARLGVILLVDPTTSIGATGLTVWESDDRARARVGVGAPFTAESQRSPSGTAPAPRESLPTASRAGDAITLRARVFAFDCQNVGQLCERLFAVRKNLTGPTARGPHTLPFSAAFAAHEVRVNRRWIEKPGFFAAGGRDSAYDTWQTGWCGGLAGTFPLLAAGGPQSRARALRTIAFALDGGQAPSGFFHGLSDGKTWFDDGFGAPLPPPAAPWPPRASRYNHPRWHLVRRSADTLTFLVKQLALLERQAAGEAPVQPSRESGPAIGPDLESSTGRERGRPIGREPGHTIDPGWTKAARLCADALVRLWDRNRQLGQFVDVESGDLVVGGSTSAGLAPAGLALAADYFKEPRYLQVAKAAGEHYFDRYVQIGLTCGGPGDALQCPDSESAAALLESFVTLFEATGDRIWIDRARAVAHLLSSWVISYDAGSMRSTGAVLSDAQSRTGMPGYVLLSGDALFRLYRATGDVGWLDLLRDTTHNLGQYLQRAEIVPGAAPGVAPGTPPGAGSPVAPDCPRVDTATWLDAKNGVVPVGGLYDAIGLLAYTEVPGVYGQTSAGFVYAFDHVEARLKERLAGRLIVVLHNPTPLGAKVRLFSESATDATEPLRPGAVLAAPTAVVPAGGTIEVAMPPMAPGG